MGAVDALALLGAAGLTIEAVGGRLVVAPADRLTDELRTLIRENKPKLRAVLAGSSGEPDAPAARWLLHLHDAEPKVLVFAPPATHSQVLKQHPGALAAEPLAAPVPDELPSGIATLLAKCIEAGLYDEADRPVLCAMHAVEAVCAWELVAAMYSRIGRCYRCRHCKRPGLSDGYCTVRTDLPHAYGFMHVLPPCRGAQCGKFKETP
jgi:hypothetical protein